MRVALLVLLVVVATLFNTWKPVHIDDAAYVTFAEHIARDPIRPYAFEMFWYDVPQPALEVLAPPVYLYWLALGAAVAPDNPAAWHAMVFPWLLLLAVSLWLLARRFGVTAPHALIAALLFSPVLLPGINLMLDVPALALGTAALAVFLGALDHGSIGRAVLAGLVLAAAFETKYTAVSIFAVWAGAAWLWQGRYRWRCLAAGLVTALVAIVGVEAWIAWGHGQSHFLVQWGLEQSRFATPIVDYLYQAAIAVPAATVLGGYALWRRQPARAARGVLWWYLACELILGVWLSPFPAMRRLLGPAVPLALLAFGSVDWNARGRGRWRHWLVGVSIASGIALWYFDFAAARLQQQAARAIAAEYRGRDHALWFSGHWGWEYYARREGMTPVVPGRSTVEAGDLVVIPRDIAAQQFALPDELRPVAVFKLPMNPPMPVTMVRYYLGAVQILPRAHPGFVADVYRADRPVRIAPLRQ